MAFLFLCATIKAQDTLEVNVDVLKEIQSPAANLLGIANTDIAKPNDPTAFMLNLSQATNNFTEVPVNYAVDLAPAWLLGAKKIDADKYLKNELGSNIWQTLVVSLAVNNADVTIDTATLKNTAFAAGIKFSLLRGKVSKETKRKLNASLDLSRKANYERDAIIQELLSNSQEWKDLQIMLQQDGLSENEIKLLQLQGQIILENIHEQALSIQKDYGDQFRDIASDLNFERKGFKLDFNAAASFNFLDQVYSNGINDKIAAWLTMSYDASDEFSLLGIARYLFNPDASFLNDSDIMITDDLSLFNAGVKLQYEKGDFSFSGEYLFQNAFDSQEVDSGYKFIVNAKYVVSKNLVLTLSFGRDFNNMITRDGNVISALNFVKGFGSKRAVSNDTRQDFNF